uniref:Uncharacterized protein n=2 Tax=Clytia hemisphaerica TaxID=252671 RepID=A0A7M5X5X8_9CNID
MERKLRLSVSEETSSDEDLTFNNSIPVSNNTPNQPSTPVFASPLMPRKSTLDTSVNENTSPLAVFASSPQAMYRRMMIENRKLKQKVRHSELFMRRQTEFEDQVTQDIETEKQDLMERNRTLLKEQEIHLQKIQDLEDVINKIKEEVEFLQLEVQAKDKELADQAAHMKKSNEVVSDMQTLLDKLSETEDELKQHKTLYEDETKKNVALTSKVYELEQLNTEMKKEMLSTKEAVESITKEMEQRKKDYSDQLAHLQEKLEKWEQKSLTQAAKTHEALSVEIQRDAEISSLKSEVKKHVNTIKVQEATIINMGYESKNIQTKKAELELQVEHLKKEIESLKKKAEESTENYKTQSNQYMDQISTLLKQVAEHTQRNEGLNAKMTNAEEKCKMLEQQIGKFEESETRINEHLQKQTKTIEEKDGRILLLQKEIEEKKGSIVSLDVEKVKMEAKLQILTEDRLRLQEIETKHQSVLYENERLKNVESANSVLESRIESLKNVEKLYEVASNEATTLQQSLHKLAEENKEITVLKKQINTLNAETTKLSAVRDQQKQDLEESQEQASLLQKEIDQLNGELSEKMKMSKNIQELEMENESVKKTVEDYKQASTNSERSHQHLMNEVEELRKIEAENKSLLQNELQLKEKLHQIQQSSDSNQNEMIVLKEEKEKALKEIQRLEADALEQAKLRKAEQIKLEEMNSVVEEARQKSDVLTKGLVHQKKEVESKETCLQESLTKVQCLQQEIVTLKESRDKHREEMQTQQQKLTELREVEIQYKIIQSENTALQSVSENLKNLSFAYEKSEQKCQSLRQEIDDLDQLRVHNTELKCQNKTLEVELKDGASRRGQLTNEIAELRSQIENTKTEYEMTLVTKTKSFEDEKNSMKSQMVNHQMEITQLSHQNESLKQSVEHFTKLQEDWKVSEQKLVRDLASQKSSNETENSTHLKHIELYHINEIEDKNKTIGDLLQKLDQWKEAHDDQVKCSERLEALNKEVLEELKYKEESFKDLEDKYYQASNDQTNQKRSTATIRSLETQLKASEEVIIKMKKQIKELESNADQPIRRSKPIEPTNDRKLTTSTIASSSDRDDSGPLLESHLTTEDKAEQIFQRSRSTRANLRRSLIVMPTTREEVTTSEEEATFQKTYSLRQRSERRRSFQPRRYMGGHTPPSKRTFLGDPAQARISMFSTEPEEEPEVHNDWGLIANLQNEQTGIPLTELSEEDRLQELQRRNTLCLPHLKSSYPMELAVDKENHIPEKVLKDTHGKRKGESEDGPRGTYKKWRTENSLSLSNDLSYLGRSTRSESSLRRDTMTLSSTKQNEAIDAPPAQQSCAFEITMDPPKKSRPNPRMTRSLASGNLKTNESTKESKTRPPVTTTKEPASRSASTKSGSKGPTSRFHRGDGVRSSFKSATQKVAASIRGRKTNK